MGTSRAVETILRSVLVRDGLHGGGELVRGTTQADRRVDNSPRSSWRIRLVFVRGGKCLGVVARIDTSRCGVSVDGMDSRADLWKSGGEVGDSKLRQPRNKRRRR